MPYVLFLDAYPLDSDLSILTGQSYPVDSVIHPSKSAARSPTSLRKGGEIIRENINSIFVK